MEVIRNSVRLRQPLVEAAQELQQQITQVQVVLVVVEVLQVVEVHMLVVRVRLVKVTPVELVAVHLDLLQEEAEARAVLVELVVVLNIVLVVLEELES